jgi:DNA-binding NarL/FixJ family response regulator
MAREAARLYARGVKPVRVLLGDIPPVLRSLIVDALRDQPDVELLHDDSDMPERRDVDVLLIGAADPNDLEYARMLLTAWPKTRIMVVSSSGRDAVVYEWYPQKLVLGDVAPRTLLNVIRQGFGERC